MTEPKTQTEAASTKCPCPGGRCGHPVTSHKFFINDDHVRVNVCRECDVEKFEGDTERFKFYTYHEVESITLAATRGLRDQLEAADETNRYARAVFRALDRYTFEDSDHGRLIAEAVKKLEETADATDQTLDYSQSDGERYRTTDSRSIK
jgi:hypothetical protein